MIYTRSYKKTVCSTLMSKAQHGFSMIEVLITVLILAIGLLGLAGLQSTGIRSNHSAYLRSQATILAYDIADRMRANRSAALVGAYTTAGSSGIPAQDIIAWKNNLAAMLPEGDGIISRTAGNRFTITVQWDDRRGENQAGTTTKSFVLRTDL